MFLFSFLSSSSQVLDLRQNVLTSLAPDDFKSVSGLQILRLDDNQLKIIHDYTFRLLRLETLGLSRNSIEELHTCSFCNSTVKRLDISHNRVTELTGELFKPLRKSLSTVNIGFNRFLVDPSRNVYAMLRQLTNVTILSLPSINLDDSLPADVFNLQRHSLVSLDLSGNKINNVSVKWLSNLTSLEQVDLSHNQMALLPASLLKRLDEIKSLKQVFLHENPWSCYRCHILPLVDWIHSNPPAYINVCNDDNDSFCVKCTNPRELTGLNLHTINEIKLEWCSDPNVSQRVATSQPRVGLVLAILIIISICAIIIAIIIVYRKKQSASYYTREDEPSEHNIFTIERLMSANSFHNIVSRKSFDNNSLLQHNNAAGPAGPFSPAQDTLSPASLSPPMSPLSPVNRVLNRASPSRSLSQSLSSIPAPPPLPPPDLPAPSSPPAPPPTLPKPVANSFNSSAHTKPKEPI